MADDEDDFDQILALVEPHIDNYWCGHEEDLEEEKDHHHCRSGYQWTVGHDDIHNAAAEIVVLLMGPYSEAAGLDWGRVAWLIELVMKMSFDETQKERLTHRG